MTAAVHIAAEDWMISAGLIGLTRLFEDDRELMDKSGVKLTSSHLDTLSEKYIYYLIKTYSIVNRDVGRMQWFVKQLNSHPDRIKSHAAEVRKIMNEQLKKVEKYFADSKEQHQLAEVVESLKNINSEAEINLVSESIERYKKIMSTPFIEEKLTINYVKAMILSPFFGQASILQPVFNSKTIQEHIEQINKDFVLPAKLELEFYEQLQSTTDVQQLISYLDEHNDYPPFKDWFKVIKKMSSMEEVHQYFSNEIFPCAFIDGLMATQSYEEKVFSPLALSREKAVNFSWDFDNSYPVPISSIARLILLLSPLGMTSYNRRLGTEQANENFRFFGLVLSQNSFIEIVRDNNSYHTKRMGGSTFEEAIVGLLSESIDKGQKQQSGYFYIEFHSDYQSKKTLLDYYHMPLYLATFLSKYGKTLTLLFHSNLRDKFLRTVLKGLDPKQIVFEYLREAIDNSFHAEGAYHATVARKRIIEAGKGVDSMGNYDKTISHVYYQGVTLRQYMGGNRRTEDGETYRASNRKKIESIAYRLLNATKAGNKAEFMDTLFRVYMSANTSKKEDGKDLTISSVFLDSFKENGLDFETIASAFIAGLLGQDESKKEEAVIHE
ncbi:hypothetical protein PASE110613_11285 [Paenibacillus sediminis]|uniref:CRISPR-associated protein Cst1 n=1 Tax=Paenibacillus sediminis TaxID=664909 RepID=A0ABS4H4S8_9BACL|nr:hypothetical protein [Paenibacillus sediminis]MBP1937538.1 CRISPR-associated protein Cst1 [Paenibacillus sediminis]